MSFLTEDQIESLALSLFRTELAYDAVLHGPELLRAPSDVVLADYLRDALTRINPGHPESVYDHAFRLATRHSGNTLLENNEQFHRLLVNGIDVKTSAAAPLPFGKGSGDGSARHKKLWLIDWTNPANNHFAAVNQFTVVEGNQHKRADVVLFVNGLPLVVIEIKNATDEKATAQKAFDQLQTYKEAIPSLFRYNAMLIATDGWFARAGTLSAAFDRFAAWKNPVSARRSAAGSPHKQLYGAEAGSVLNDDGERLYQSALFAGNEQAPELEPLLLELLNRHTLPDFIRHFIVFERTRTGTVKKMAAYHQYYAVNKALQSTIRAASPLSPRERGSGGEGPQKPQDGAGSGGEGGRAGVVWHTQGSGKSLSMVFYAGKLVLAPALQNPTIVVLTDRNDLDQQLFDTFTNCQHLLRQKPVQAESRAKLKELLSVASGGVVFTTIQKFLPDEKGGAFPCLTERRNVVVIADEAHRSQYDFIDGFARHLRDALPNATFIGFTGTPIEKEDKSTRAIFGDYIDVYDIQQAVDDGATVRIFYESRLARIDLNAEEQTLLDERIEEVTEEDELTEKQQRFARWTQQEAIVGSEGRLRQVAEDLVRHFEERCTALEGKAMIVCMSRRICVALHYELVKLRPEWYDEDDSKGALKVIMTGSSSDPLHWQPHIRNKPRRKTIGDRLKDPNDPLRLVIVRDMWLTGFDAPCLPTLYVDKPMTGHNLMQAIARVNRVFKNKEGGLIVDYLGIAQDLKKALHTYTESGGRGKIEYDIDEAADKMMELYEVVAGLFEGFDYKAVFLMEPREKLQFLLDATNHILGLEKGRERFTTYVTNLSKAFALAVTHPLAATIRDELAFFQAVKARIAKLREGLRTRTNEEVETAIRQIVSNALVSSEVIDVFAAAGLEKPDVSILSDEFLAEIKGMPRKNLALELLKRLLNDEIRIRARTNLMQGRKFSELLADAIKRYQANAITAAQIIEEMMRMAKELREAGRRGEELGLDYRELAFYDALEANETAQQVLGHDIIRHIARELVASIKKNVTIDWDRKESVQAAMRVSIKRILKKHGYPPDDPKTGAYTTSVDRVLTQAKMLAEDWMTQ